MTQDLWETVVLDKVLHYRKEFIQINDLEHYKRCRVQCHVQGIVLRDVVQGIQIRTKSQQVCRANDFLVAEIDAKLGRFGIVPEDLEGAIVSSHYYLYEIDKDLLDKQFFYFFIKTSYFRDQVSAQGSTNYAAIRSNDVLGYKMPLPPIAEQKRIVTHIEKLAEKIEEVQKLRKSGIKELEFLYSIALSKFLKGLPLDSCLANILLDKPRNGWSARCDNMSQGIPVLSLGAITGFHYRETQFKRTSEPVTQNAHYWLKPGDLLITRSNTPELVGHASIYNGIPSPCIYPDLMMRLDVDESKADKQFVHHWLASRTVRNFIQLHAKGTSPTMKKISQGIVMSIPFPSNLSIAEQKRFAIYLDSLQTQVDNMKSLRENALLKFDALLPAILDKAFKGEL